MRTLLRLSAMMIAVVWIAAGVVFPASLGYAQEATAEATAAAEAAAEGGETDSESASVAAADTGEETTAPPGLTLFVLLIGLAAVSAVGFAVIGQENIRFGDDE